MAQNAELLLKVGLDLSHFRQQLTTIGSQLAGQPLSINVKFDRAKIVSEFRLLDRYIRNKKFYVEVNTNLKTEVDRAVRLTELLKNMPKGGGAARTPGVVEKGFSQAQLKNLGQNIKPLYKAAADAGLVAFNEAIANNVSKIAKELTEVGKNSITGLLNGLNSGDAQIKAAAQSLGKTLIQAIKADLGIASPSKETGKLGKFAAQGFEQGFISGIVKAERSMARAIRASLMGAIREGFSNLPGMGGALVSFERQLAASVQLAVRKAVRQGLASSVVPGAKGGLLGGTGGAVTGAAVGGTKALGAGVAGGVAKLTAGGIMGTAANLVRYSIDSGAYQEFVGKLYQEIIHSALSSGTQGAIIGALAVGGVAGGVGFAKGATGSLIIQAVTAIRNRILAALIAVSTGELNNVVKVAVRDVTGLVFRQVIRQLRSANAQLPAINWPSALPPARGVSTATTMALPGRATPASLPGTTFGAQKRLIGDILDPSLKEILRGAANAFVDAVRQGMNNAVRAVIVRDLGAVGRPMLGGGRVAGLLSAGVGRAASPYAMGGAGGGLESKAELFARREREARIRSNLRGIDVLGGGGGRGAAPYSYVYRPARPSSAIVPYVPGGAIIPTGGGGADGGGGRPPSGGNGGGGRRGGGGNMFGGLPNISLPGSGAIRELGQEFAFATKQVLLFGQAYKLLAFLQDFPAQVGQAVSQLQSFRNTLAAISPTAQEVVASNDLILSLVNKYNVPLQSARDGFTKLYASMQPAGFSGDQIRGLFTGVSKAAATFGMSSDKIDRVNYAFAQMASKGQVMSEELKGQLGDVLPGAMAIFAQAAGFKGPEAISKFSAALEDGRYKGTAMMELLNNVSIVLNQKFSVGAEGAAKTFQGAINNMQTSMKALYESFEPIAISFLNGVVTPVMDGVKTITDGFNAFFTGAQAQTAGGFALAQTLEQLQPSFEGIKNNAMEVVGVLGQFAKVALGLGQILLQIAGNPIAGYLLKIYAIILPINIALNAMRGFWALNSLQLLIFQARMAAGTGVLTAFRGMMAATGATAATTAASIRGAGLALRTFFATTGVGLVVVGISILIERFMTMNQALADTKAKALGAAQAIRAMSATEARQAEFQAARDVKVLQQLSQQRQSGGAFGPKYLITNKEQQAALQRAGVTTETIYNKQQGYGLAQGARIEDIAGAIQARQGIMREAQYRQTQVKFEEQQANKPISFAEIKGGGGGDSGAADKTAKKTEQAAQKARELKATLDQLREQIRIETKALNLQQAIANARADGNEELANAIEAQEKAYSLDEKVAKLQRDLNAGKIKDVEFLLRLQLLSAEYRKIDLDEEERLNAIFRERYGLTKDIVEAARRARENAFGLGLGGANAFRTDISLMPKLTGGELGDKLEKAREDLSGLTNAANQVAGAAEAIGSAFGQSFKGMITGSMTAQQALANFFQSTADHFADMVAQMIAKWLEVQLIQGLGNLLGMFNGGMSGIFGAGGAPNYSGAFGAGGPTFQPSLFTAANGAVWKGGFQAFANGGLVTGPTMGLVGEGRYNEAVVPLPNGKSIPVDLGNSMQGGVNVVVNVDAKGTEVEGNEGQSRQLGKLISVAVQSELVKQQRPGGLLAGRR